MSGLFVLAPAAVYLDWETLVQMVWVYRWESCNFIPPVQQYRRNLFCHYYWIAVRIMRNY